LLNTSVPHLIICEFRMAMGLPCEVVKRLSIW
jgi:hypothetical protein